MNSKRLTMYTPDGACLILKADNEKNARQELMEKFKEACNKLAELEDKLENGTLIEIPLKGELEMTPQEAIKILDAAKADYFGTINTAFDLAIESLEKQIPIKPIELKNGKDLKIGASIWRAGVPVYKCPNCESFISHSSRYCSNCGQAIDRSK